MSTLSVVLLPDACLATICCNQLNSALCVLSFFVFALRNEKKIEFFASLAVAHSFCCPFGALMNWRTLCFRLANISKHFAEHNIVYIYMGTDRACSEIKIEKGRPVFKCVCVWTERCALACCVIRKINYISFFGPKFARNLEIVAS